MIKDIKKGYITAQNNIVLVQDDGTVEKPKDPKDFFLLAGSDGNTKITATVLKIQECEGVAIYIILTNVDEGTSLEEIFKLFLEGKYLIGTSEYYFENHYENGFITNIKSFDEDEHSEIKLHYTKPHTYTDKDGDKVNNSWRTITWDLFDEFVNKN